MERLAQYNIMYDLIIIGGGPAGSAAGVYAARKKLKTLLLTAEFGGQSIVSSEIQNWIGTPAISGMDLAENLRKHVKTYAGESLTVAEGDRAVKIEKAGGSFSVATEQGKTYSGKTILIASGSARRKLPAKNADTLEHKGLTYCASCDGPLFEGQDVAVVGGGNAGFETAAQLLAYTKSVTLLNHSEGYKADPVTVEKVLNNPKMKAIDMADVLEIKGEKFVNGLVYKDKRSGEEKELPVTGIFVEIGQVPNTDLVKGLVELDQYNRIKIDPWTQKTSAEGIWAAGDSTNVLYHQNNIAAGDAVRAIENIYLALNVK